MKKVILFILFSMFIFTFSFDNKFLKREKIKPDFESYEQIRDSYYRDKDYIYYNGERQFLVDPNSFEVLNSSYSKDKNGVYRPKHTITHGKTVTYYLYRLSNIDINTFISYETNREINRINYDAEDKNNYYRYGSVVKKKEFVE